MAYELFWLVPDKVLYIQFTGALHVESYKAGVSELHDLIDQSSNSQVYLIFDIQQVPDIGLSVQQIKTHYRRHPNLKRSVIIKPTNSIAATWAKTVVEVMYRLFGWDHIRIVNTWDDAVSSLVFKDPSLEGLLTDPQKIPIP